MPKQRRPVYEYHATPPFLRKKLKTNAAVLKQDQDKQTMILWKNNWSNSPRGKHDHAIDRSSPSKKILKIISNPKLPRQESSIISQLCITHIPLNSYLFCFKHVDNPRCPACGEEQKTIEYFLLHCPAYAHERWVLKKAMKGELELKMLLENK